ncbi:hypothetical protein QBC44DRAFT_315491 [Cladorrhinum sp. PSN332]|nr:hypothetical protein QBC44DRAFT_315491 [Cladorrhinum sp. PSN332]
MATMDFTTKPLMLVALLLKFCRNLLALFTCSRLCVVVVCGVLCNPRGGWILLGWLLHPQVSFHQFHSPRARFVLVWREPAASAFILHKTADHQTQKEYPRSVPGKYDSGVFGWYPGRQLLRGRNRR